MPSIEDVKTADTRPKLTRAQKVEVVGRLAAFEQPAAIAKAMKADHGVEITPQAIAFYDPTRYAGRACPKCWSDLFWTMRAEFIAGIADVGIAHGTVRLRWLDEMARAQMDKGNTAEARALLKQAADEMSRMAGHKDGASDGSGKTPAELKAGIEADAAKLGLAVVPIESLARHGGDGAAGEPQPAGEPLSG